MNQEKMPRKNHRLKILIFLFILIIVLSSIVAVKYMKSSKQADFVSESSGNLYEDFKKGIITKDQYVLYNLYLQYEPELLNGKYSEDNIKDTPLPVEELIEECYDELSDETIDFFVNKVNLTNITFDINKENNTNTNSSVTGAIIPNVYAKESSATNLNKAVISSNKRFVVWYTTTGSNKITDSNAKKNSGWIRKLDK